MVSRPPFNLVILIVSTEHVVSTPTLTCLYLFAAAFFFARACFRATIVNA